MDLLTQDFLGRFINLYELPCISLYQPTHRSHSDNEQGVIRFKNLIKKIQHLLEKKYLKNEIQSPLIVIATEIPEKVIYKRQSAQTYFTKEI